MNRRQTYALTHPLDEAHMAARMPHCRRVREIADGVLLTTILAVDR
jgi:hypothetical protein